MKNKYLSIILTISLLPFLASAVNADDKLLPLWDGWWPGVKSTSRLTHPGKAPYGTVLNTRFALENDEKFGKSTWHAGLVFQLGDTDRIKSNLELLLYHAGYNGGYERYLEVYVSTITWDTEVGATLDELELDGLFEYVDGKGGYKVKVDNINTFKVLNEPLISYAQYDPFIVDSLEFNKFVKKNSGKRISVIISGDHGGASFYSTDSSNPEHLHPAISLIEPSSSDKNVFKKMVKESNEIRVEY